MYFNVEHSWGDAAVSAHLIEYILYCDVTKLGYKPSGDCNGEVEAPVELQRLQWDLNEEVRRARDEARRAAQEAQRASGIKVLRSQDNGAFRSTKIDIGKAQIVFSDDKGEMKIETVDGKKQLTAKDPQGKLLFSGPVETKEELDKVPAEVRQRFDKLQEKDLPNVTLSQEDDNNEDMDNDEENSASMDQVSNNMYPFNGWFPRNALA